MWVATKGWALQNFPNNIAALLVLGVVKGVAVISSLSFTLCSVGVLIEVQSSQNYPESKNE